MSNNYVVYVHINKTNGKRYYGITCQKPERRWRNGNGYKTQYFVNAINKYGWDGFEHIIMARGLTEEEAKWLEIEMIAAYNTTNPRYGYNMTKGGEGANGHIVSKETREKISIALSGENNPGYGKKGNLCPHFGIRRSEETRKKISESKKGVYLGKNNPKAKSVICINTKRIFYTAKEAQEYYGISKHVASCCSGTRKSCGKLNGQPLKWRYVNYKHNKTYRVA